MNAGDRRQLVESICWQALERPRASRAVYLREACGDDAALYAEIESLLAQASAGEHFLRAPVGAVAAALVPDDSPHPLIAPGTRLGEFEVVAALGAGGQGRVFRARDTDLRRDVAVKVLAEQGNDPEVRASLLREARRAAQLNHPGICQVFHVRDSPHGPYMVMELVDGQTLGEIVAAGPLPVERTCRIGREIAQALDHAHAHGIVHRDLKCTNVMLTREGRVKVLDFGIAAVLPGADPEHSVSTTRSGVTERFAGTLPYMAPEVLRGEGSNISSDIWALGVVLYEMTAGHRPFDRPAPSDLVASILRDPPAAMPSGTPPHLAHLVGRCLSKEAAERPARAGEVALALEVASLPTPPSTPRSTIGGSPPPARSGWGVAKAVAAVTAVAGIAWLGLRPSLMPSDPEDRPLRLQRAVQVTSATGVEEAPALSPDGRTIAYAASPSGEWTSDWDILVTQLRGTPVNRTADHPGRDVLPSWSPDGTQIAFWSDRDGGGCYVMPAVGGAARRVAAASFYDWSRPVWSSDGRELSCVVGDAFQAELATFAVETGESRGRVRLPGRPRWMHVSPSPERTRVAMVVSSGGYGSDLTQLVLLDAATGKSETLTDGQSAVWSPTWSSDGSLLHYVSNAGGSSDVWTQRFENGARAGDPVAVSTGIGVRNFTISADGRTIAYSQGRKLANLWRLPILADRPATWADATQITSDQAFVEFADVSPDGQRLAISSDRAGSFDLWVLPAGGGELRQVTSGRGAELAPRWSPDGHTFVFYSFKSGNRDIWTMPTLGGAWKQVTTNPGPDLHPRWSPDGKAVVYLTGREGFNAAWVTPLSGGEGREIARTASSGSYSPDGRQIAFAMNGRIVRRSASGAGEIVAVSRTPGFNAIWAPDGSRLFFASANGPRNLFAVDSNGNRERAVTDLRGRRGIIVTNSIATDGEFLYFSWQEDLGDLWTADLVR